jgi:hypothetical protein
MVRNEVPQPSGPFEPGRQPSLGQRPGPTTEMWTRGVLGPVSMSVTAIR